MGFENLEETPRFLRDLAERIGPWPAPPRTSSLPGAYPMVAKPFSFCYNIPHAPGPRPAPRKDVARMTETLSYRSTRMACYRSYITQGIANNLSPLFFVIFQREFGISYAMISTLILFNFVTQIAVDGLCVKFIDRIGYRKAMVAAHICCTAGLVMLGLLPKILPNPFLGLVLATMTTAIGGGAIEVVVSPLIDSLPSEEKEAKMSLLHSFYCWGQVAVVLLTTLAVRLIGQGLWWVLPFFWAILPCCNIFSFARVPMAPEIPPEEKTPLGRLGRSPAFWLAMLLMLCAGASELAMSQWSSLFAEQALGAEKLWGDILGPCLFAVFMGIGRTIYGVWGGRLNLRAALVFTAALCVLCYLGAALLPSPMLSLLCCGLCGFSISLMWPGVLSSTAAIFPKGGASMFGLLAVCGDIGCSSGPALAGLVSEFAGLRTGMLSAGVFPAVMLVCLVLGKPGKRGHQEKALPVNKQP